jgi:hypothetical protein
LDGATAKQERTHLLQHLSAQFEADEKHQEDDTDLAHLLDEHEVVDPAECVWADQHASSEKTNDRNQPDSLR